MGATFRRYWPWWTAFIFLLTYEAIALTGVTPTLSQMVWTADARWPYLELATGLGVVVLFVHFFYRNRRRP